MKSRLSFSWKKKCCVHGLDRRDVVVNEHAGAAMMLLDECIDVCRTFHAVSADNVDDGCCCVHGFREDHVDVEDVRLTPLAVDHFVLSDKLYCIQIRFSFKRVTSCARVPGRRADSAGSRSSHPFVSWSCRPYEVVSQSPR